MPALIRHSAPSFNTAPTGGYQPGAGAQYAEAGQWNRAQYDQRRTTDLINSGMEAFGGAAKSYFDNQGQQQRTAEARAYQEGRVADQRKYAEGQKNDAEAKLQKHRDNFLDGLNKVSPETINDPDFRPFGAAIASGAIDPTHAMAGYEAVKKSKADQAGKADALQGTADYRNRSLDLRQQGQANTHEYQQGNLDLRGRTLDETVNQHGITNDQRNRSLDQSQYRIDHPKLGSPGSDPVIYGLNKRLAEVKAQHAGVENEIRYLWQNTDLDAGQRTERYHELLTQKTALNQSLKVANQQLQDAIGGLARPQQPATPPQQMQQRLALDPFEAFAAQHPELKTAEQLTELWKQQQEQP